MANPVVAPPAASVRGRITVHPRGFGFLTVPIAGGEALTAFVTPPDLNPFLADDLVEATLQAAQGGRYTATALRLVERPRRQVFGEVVVRRGALFLRADREVANTDWPLDLDAADAPVAAGSLVVGRVEEQRLVLARVVPADADPSVEQIMARHGLLADFPADVLCEARGAAAGLDAALRTGARRDLRDLPLVTVDAPSTRDIDDAIAVLPAGPDGALRVLVAIADVGALVPEGSPLDLCARERGTSVYLAGRVLPMLPAELSEVALSLLPGQDRLCLVAELRVDSEGQIRAVDVYEGLMRSAARLNYTELAAYLDHGEVSLAMAPVRATLPWLRAASARLALLRSRRGGVELREDEAHIVLDAVTGLPAAVESVRPTSAHLLIERFMVAANEAIAGWLCDRGVPVLYRVHDQPDGPAVADLAAAAEHFGFAAGFGPTLSPLALSAFDLQIRGASCEPALRSVLRRSLGPARYTAQPLPHFGLAAPLYLHFTSPIRRYADLCVHRQVKAYLRGQRSFSQPQDALEPLGQHLNGRSRGAARAENDRHRVLLARLMAGRIGQVHAGHVTRIRPFGLQVQLDATLVEGILPLEALPGGPLRPDGRLTALLQPDGARCFPIGTPLQVRVAGADALLGRVEFALAQRPEA